MAEEKSSEPPVDPTGPAAPALPPTAEKGPPPEESEDWATRFKYLFADFENFRKRASKERDSLRRAVRADVVLALLPTYEAVQRAREAVARLPPTDPVRRGIDLLVHEFETFLDGERVTTVARTGEPFRADWHEAVAEAPPARGRGRRYGARGRPAGVPNRFHAASPGKGRRRPPAPVGGPRRTRERLGRPYRHDRLGIAKVQEQRWSETRRSQDSTG